MAATTATNGGAGAKDLAPRILTLLPGKQSDVARALGRKPSDGTVRRTLDRLATSGFVRRDDGVWRLCQALPGTEDDADLAIPEDFDHESTALFARTRRQLLDQGTFKDSDLPLLERYVRSKQLAREARAAATAAGGYQKASSGRVFKHPGVEDARQHERDAHVYADALILTPAARKRHGQADGDGGDGDALDF